MTKRITPPRRTTAGKKNRRATSTRPRPSGYQKRKPESPPPWKIIGAVAAVVVILGVAGFFAIRAFNKPSPTSGTASLAPTTSAQMPETSASPAATKQLPATATPKSTTEAVIAVSALPPDIPALQQYMLQLINQDRRANGLSEVLWDNIAATAGQRHAQEMSTFGYISHWNLDGYGPDYRYTAAGGLDSVQENISVYTHTLNFPPGDIEAWRAIIRTAEEGLMKSPAHKDNILSPEHTHVGIGIAYNAEKGFVAISQEFVNRYVKLSPLPAQAGLNDKITISGRLLTRSDNVLASLAYQPFPAPKTVIELNKTNTYTHPEKIYETVPLLPDASGQFTQEITLNNHNQPGLYHIMIFIDAPVKRNIQAANIIINVR